MKQTIKKVVRYMALAAFVVGVVLTAFGALINQVAFNTFVTLLNQGGFKAFLIGILLIVISIVLLFMSFFVGRGKDARPVAQKPAPRDQEIVEAELANK